ncbi:MAG: nucleoside-diphosphate kinase [Pseudomonadota bacterium]
MERTLGIIKPDAFKKKLTGEIIKRYTEAGFNIIGMKLKHLSEKEAQGFYCVHKGKPFFDSLVEFMTSGPCVVVALEAEDVIKRNREIMGATNPENAEPGTIRKDFADSIQNNCVHGSDAPETAAFEIGYFFSAIELV